MNYKAWSLAVLSVVVSSCVGRHIDSWDGYSSRRTKPSSDWVPLDLRFGSNTVRCQMYVPHDLPGTISRAWKSMAEDSGAVNRAFKETSIGSQVGRMWRAFWNANTDRE